MLAFGAADGAGSGLGVALGLGKAGGALTPIDGADKTVAKGASSGNPSGLGMAAGLGPSGRALRFALVPPSLIGCEFGLVAPLLLSI